MAEMKLMTLAAQQYYDEKIKVHIANEDAKLREQLETHVHSWNDLEDKPFGEETTVVEEQIQLAVDEFGHIAPSVQSIFKNLAANNKEVTVVFNNERYSEKVNTKEYNSFEDLEDGVSYWIGGSDSVVYMAIARTSQRTEDRFEINGEDCSMSEFTSMVQLYTSIENDIVTHLDEKFIPDTIARISDIENIDLTPYETKTDAAAKLDEAKAFASEEDAKVQAAVDTLSGKVTTLIGEDANKSVRTIANEELAKQLVAEGAKESLDTLTEIAAWIQSHPDDASAMNKAINDLEALVGALPDGVTATTVIGYVQEVVAAEKSRAEGVEAGLDGRLATVEGAVATVDTRIATAKEETAADAASKDAEVLAQAQNGIAAVQAAVDAHAGNADIHVTTEDKAKWNAAEENANSYTDTVFAQIKEVTNAEIDAMFNNNVAVLGDATLDNTILG